MLNFTSDAASNGSHVVSFSLPLGFGDFVAIQSAALLSAKTSDADSLLPPGRPQGI
jgi:hypothetical protein